MADKKSKARAFWSDAQRRVAETSEAAVDRVDEKTDGKASQTFETTRRVIKETTNKTHEITTSAVEKGAETEAGATALKGAKTGLEALANLPLFTAVGDSMQARQGVTRLAERLQEDPFDPMPPVWLAEALLRAQREQRGVNAARTAINPLRVPLQVAIKAVATANEERPQVPVVTQLLGRSYVLALARLGEELTAHELHALSRVYLARGAPQEAVRLAQGSIAVGGDETAEAAVTLARAHGQRKSIGQAWAAAQLAIESGSTLGYQIIAELPAPEAAQVGSGGRIDHMQGVARSLSNEERVDLVSRVVAEDVARYRGVALKTGDQIGDLLDRQRKRFRAQVPKVKEAGARLKRKATGDD